MMLVLTLLCRDEADILESMLRFHLAQGVDRIIATDNGSVDGSVEILQRFERRGQLTLLHEAEHTHDQAVWVTRMARMAAAMGADWVINSDADEFWCSAPISCRHPATARISGRFTNARPCGNGCPATASASLFPPS